MATSSSFVRSRDQPYTAAVQEAARLITQTDAPAARHYLGLARYQAGDANGAREMLGSIRRGDRPDVRAQASLASVEGHRDA